MKNRKRAGPAWARRYRTGTQPVAPGGRVRLPVWESGDKTFLPMGDGGCRLPAGWYLLAFTADGVSEGAEAGAVFTLNGAQIVNTLSLLPGGGKGRLALLTLLPLLGSGELAVEHPGPGQLRCTNGEMTILRLG
ncbi:MAG: hypothetical protein J5927_01015 [Oscillospiraceae bacterium]|nr:hypothetical protein [Oscillospiraceae bacterium]